jgi:hypothetical protein
LLKARRCPFCGKVGTLNFHSLLKGNHPCSASGRCWRGQRIFCSNRGHRGGCGKTFPVFFAHIIPRHTFAAPLLWAIMTLTALTRLISIKAAWEQSGHRLSLDGFYHLLQRLRHRLATWRSALCRLITPPAGCHVDPFKQTIEHFHVAFAFGKNALSAFQMRFQTSVAG